jgi:hypothetical protein
MSKQTSEVVQTGQLEGAKITISALHNQGLQESITIINHGTVVQPMSGWVLASLRGQVFYQFPDDLRIRPGMSVVVNSGQQKIEIIFNKQLMQTELFWATGQVWNNHGDTALLFDANDLEIDRYSYPHERVMGSSDKRKKSLKRGDNGFEIVEEVISHAQRGIRKQSDVMSSPS